MHKKQPELASTIIAEAHRQHTLVWAHATLFPAKPSDLVAAGVDAISHACLLVHETEQSVPHWPVTPQTIALDQFPPQGKHAPRTAHSCARPRTPQMD